MKKFLYSVAMDQKKGVLFIPLKVGLYLLSLVYGFGQGIVKFLYKIGVYPTHRLPKPVISVGNISLGGVGKTPIVEWIAKTLLSQGKRPVILMRGYMDQNKIKNSSQDPAQSDEAQMLRERLGDVPVLVGANRVLKAQEFLAKGNSVDVFILDDGFQHWRLYRDLDIVAIDSMNPFGNRCLLPRGILREPLSSLQRADILMLTKVSHAQESALPQLKKKFVQFSDKPLVETDHVPRNIVDLRTQEVLDLSIIKGQDVCCFCAIGNPDSFAESLKVVGVNVVKRFFYLDHHVFNPEDMKKIINYCINNTISIIICTIKDYVKIVKLGFQFPENIRIFAMSIELEIVHGKDFLIEGINRISHP